jgi:ABC-2 type transport system permease protein
MSGTWVYTRFEILRLFRNRQSMVISLFIPLVLFLSIGAPQKNQIVTGDVTFGRYYLAGMTAFGSMAAVFAGGARIAMERQIGWNRQLRLTPLRPSVYFRTKVLTSYVLALLSVLVLSGTALAIGVHLSFGPWIEGLGLVVIALIPFAAIGVMVGHLIRGDAIGPAIGMGVSFFAILGGAYFPIGGASGFMHDLVRAIPSFWLVQADQTGIGGKSWTWEAWLVIAVWAIAVGAIAVWAYRRDTQRQQ